MYQDAKWRKSKQKQSISNKFQKLIWKTFWYTKRVHFINTKSHKNDKSIVLKESGQEEKKPKTHREENVTT